MRVVFKYIVWLLSFFTLIIYYILGTTLGHTNIGYLMEDYFTKKMGNKIELLSLDISEYPFIIAELKINDTTLLSLKGDADAEDMDMDYHLRGKSFIWSDYNLSDPVDLKGTIVGKVSELLIKGGGEIFYGQTNYSFIRKPNRFEKIVLNLEESSAKHLLKFLEYDLELEGNLNVLMNFEYFSSFRKKGLAKISMRKAIMPNISGDVEFSLDTEIAYIDLLREFFLDIHSDIGKLRVAHGYYNKSAGILKAEYGLQLKELAYFEKLLGSKYEGELSTAGEVKYESKKLSLLGDSTSYGGLLKYDYKNDYLDMDFHGVSLEKILRQLSFPALLSSKIYGTASYDIQDEIILVNTKLKETRFRRTKMTDKIYEVTDIDIRKDVYNNSIFTAAYQDEVLTSFLQIDNGINHLYLKNTKMNSKTNAIIADFEVLIEGEEFFGEIYGTLEEPEVNLDMSRLIKYQINKKIENFFGTTKPLNKKNIKQNVNKNELEDVQPKTRIFLDGFFD